MSEFKPSVGFLRKVADGGVYAWMRYSQKKGGYWGFTGGEQTYKAHVRAGYVEHHGAADLGRRAIVTLTDAGKQALARSNNDHQKDRPE